MSLLERGITESIDRDESPDALLIQQGLTEDMRGWCTRAVYATTHTSQARISESSDDLHTSAGMCDQRGSLVGLRMYVRRSLLRWAFLAEGPPWPSCQVSGLTGSTELGSHCLGQHHGSLGLVVLCSSLGNPHLMTRVQLVDSVRVLGRTVLLCEKEPTGMTVSCPSLGSWNA